MLTVALPDVCDLRHVVSIQRESVAADGGGGGALTWTTVHTVRAEVLPLSGREQLHLQQLEAAVTHRVTTRWIAGVTPKMRLLFKGRPMNIRVAINLEERDLWLQMLCEEGVAT